MIEYMQLVVVGDGTRIHLLLARLGYSATRLSYCLQNLLNS